MLCEPRHRDARNVPRRGSERIPRDTPIGKAFPNCPLASWDQRTRATAPPRHYGNVREETKSFHNGASLQFALGRAPAQWRSNRRMFIAVFRCICSRFSSRYVTCNLGWRLGASGHGTHGHRPSGQALSRNAEKEYVQDLATAAQTVSPPFAPGRLRGPVDLSRWRPPGHLTNLPERPGRSRPRRVASDTGRCESE